MRWMCAECGRPHEHDDPPCESCGAMRFEPTTVRDPDDDAGGGGSEPFAWQCVECGTEHAKHSPPCRSCGGMQLEGVAYEESTLSDDDAWLPATGRREVLGVLGGVAILGAVAAGEVFAQVPSIRSFADSGSGSLSLSDVPGHASEASGIDLEVAATEAVNRLGAFRAGNGMARLEESPPLRETATYFNRHLVKYQGEEPVAAPPAEAYREFGGEREFGALAPLSTRGSPKTIRSVQSTGDLAEGFTEVWTNDYRDTLLDETVAAAGVDFHVDAEGYLYGTAAFA